MVRRSESRGDPKATKPAEVSRILRLAKANRNDVFYDLGCGHGCVCIIAAKKVKRVVGIEDHIATYKEAVKAVKKAGLQDKVKIRNCDFMTAKIGDATILYSTVYEDHKDIYHFERVLKNGSRFVSAGIPLIGIKPNKVDGTFYLMRMPFKRATSEDDWAKSVLGTKNGTATKLFKKYRKWYGRQSVKDLRKILARRLKTWQNN